jgi:cytoskeletal protein RodZ
MKQSSVIVRSTEYMDDLGSILREARETKGLSYKAVQEEIRINERYLQALEEGKYDLLPTPVHIRGYLRNYAHFLELDPKPLLECYELNTQARPIRVNGQGAYLNGFGYLNDAQAIPPITEQPFFNPVNVELEESFGGRDSESTLRLAIIIALMVAIILVANRFIPLITGRGDGSQNVETTITTILNEAIPDDEASPTTTSNPFAPADDGNGDNPVPSTSRNASTNSETAVTTLPPRPVLPATMERIELRLDITERTWVRVTIDGEVVLEDLLTREDGPYVWEALQEARVLTGGASGVFVTINGIEWGRMGERGAVVEEAWQVTN